MIIFQNDNKIEIDSREEYERFAQSYRLIHAAGGIVCNECGERLMIFRLGRWDFPKGKVEEGESYAEAAVREVEEETGLRNIMLREPLDSTFHTYELNGEPVLKETHWFNMFAHSQSLVPQTVEDITQAVWVPEEEVDKKMQASYPSLADLWDKIKK